MTCQDIPDTMMLTGRTAAGTVVSVPAGALRNPCLKPSLKGVKLFIGLPVYQKVDTYFMQALIALQRQKPCDIEIEICQGDGIGRSRNQLTAAFLRSDCTHLLFIDCDLIFDAEQIARLLSHNLPIVGGFYPKKQQGALEWVLNTLPGNPGLTENQLQPVRYAGTGFLCIKREVFEQMAAKYPEIGYREDYGARGLAHDFWSMGVYKDPANPNDEGRYLSEDWYFCQRWNDMGGQIYLDARVILKHIGVTIFPLLSQEAEINNPKLAETRLPASDHAPKTVLADEHPDGLGRRNSVYSQAAA